ncbi:MAG: ABC transporter permease [Bacteroidota bacterium]|nr:ABC transporter permease [Bacteroidota bacterium]
MLNLALKNLLHQKLRNAFNILLIALAVGLILLTVLINEQFKNHFEKNLADIDLIIGAKGSPLQSVLCNMFHIDAPTGNIELKDIKPFLNSNHPVIKEYVALNLGDNYLGYRILGTTLEYFSWYSLSLQEGDFFEKDMQLVVGNDVAKNTQLKLGDQIVSGHGIVQLDDELNTHQHNSKFEVVGILKKSNTISDRLVFCSLSSYWLQHGLDHDPQGGHEHAHSNPIIINDDLKDAKGPITSLLLRFKGQNVQALNFGRAVNENTPVMATSPAIELNRMYELTGSASDLLEWLGLIAGVMAILSIFISLLQALNERKLELAILRLGGAGPGQVFRLIFYEALILTFIGTFFGFILAHIGLEYLSIHANFYNKYEISGFYFASQEKYILIGSMFLGLFAGLIPAISAYRIEIHKTLKEI